MSECFPASAKRLSRTKWAHDEELRFKVLARRNRHLGHWAAGEMGLTGHQSTTTPRPLSRPKWPQVDDGEIASKNSRPISRRRKIARTDSSDPAGRWTNT